MKLLRFLAGLALRLNRNVMQGEIRLQARRHRLADSLAVGAGRQLHVDRAARLVRSGDPDVQVVNARDAKGLADRGADVGEDYAARRPLQEDVRGVAQQDPGARQHPKANGDGDDGSTQVQPVNRITSAPASTPKEPSMSAQTSR